MGGGPGIFCVLVNRPLKEPWEGRSTNMWHLVSHMPGLNLYGSTRHLLQVALQSKMGHATAKAPTAILVGFHVASSLPLQGDVRSNSMQSMLYTLIDNRSNLSDSRLRAHMSTFLLLPYPYRRALIPAEYEPCR